MEYILDPSTLLPWPRFDWLLTAGPEVQPELSIAARQILLTAARNWRDADGKDWGAWFPIHSSYQVTTDELHLAGYLQKHPDNRKRTWYGITEAGLTKARQMEDSARSERQQILERRRGFRFAEIQRALALDGYYRLPEPGRRWEAGEVAFFRPVDGKRLLLTCRLGSINWAEYDRNYYQPTVNAAPKMHIRLDTRSGADIPF